MSFIPTKDPHPGRCKNLRPVTHNDGHIENLRCLEYENEPHQCSFPESTHVVVETNNIFRSSDPPQPEPWIRPDNLSEKG